jgi:hypothetical protein
MASELLKRQAAKQTELENRLLRPLASSFNSACREGSPGLCSSHSAGCPAGGASSETGVRGQRSENRGVRS